MGIMSVVSIPLITEKWQSDLLDKRFEMCRQVYNTMLHYELKQLRKMERREEYKRSKAVIADAYKNLTPQKRKQSEELKQAVETQKELMKEYRFSKFGFTNDVSMFYRYFNENVFAEVAGRSIAEPMWSAFEDYFYGSGRQIRYKRKGDWQSMATSGKSGIRLVDESGKTVRGQRDGRKLYCLCGTNKGKVAKMPLKIDDKDSYKLEMLEKTYKCVRLTRKEVRGKLKWYVQLTVDGAPAIKYTEDGEVRNPIREGNVWLYVDTAYVLYTTDNKNYTAISLKNTEADIATGKRLAEIQQYMDNSRRTTNPENFNEDGTIKKGIMVDGQRHRLHWTFSNGYRQAVKELRNIYRVQAENRKEERIIIANEILSHGNKITVNDYPFQYAAMRKKENELTEKGTLAKKKKAGYAIGHNAPALLVTLLDQKLKSAGYDGVTKVKLDVTNEIEEGDKEIMGALKTRTVEIKELASENRRLKDIESTKDKYRMKSDDYKGFLDFIKEEIPDAYRGLVEEYNKQKSMEGV